MSDSIPTLRANIFEVIKDDDYDINDLKLLLDPVSEYILDPVFLTNVNKIAAILMEDRDGDNKFTVDDLELLQEDPIAVASMLTGVLAILTSISSVEFKYESGATEEIVFKLLSFLFLVVIPKESGTVLSMEDKTKILNLILAMYNAFKASQAFKMMSDKLVKLFQSKGWCKCICGTPQTKEEVVAKKLEEVDRDIKKQRELR
jgi:hypothetical protein